MLKYVVTLMMLAIITMVIYLMYGVMGILTLLLLIMTALFYVIFIRPDYNDRSGIIAARNKVISETGTTVSAMTAQMEAKEDENRVRRQRK